MQPQSTWDPGRAAMFLVQRAAKLFMRRADVQLRALGLGTGHVPVLRVLADGGARSQTALAEHANIEQPTMAQMLVRMERDGLVKRAPNPGDARSSLFSLTPRALAKVHDARQVLIDGTRIALAGLSDADDEKLVELLERVIANLEQEPVSEPAAPRRSRARPARRPRAR